MSQDIAVTTIVGRLSRDAESRMVGDKTVASFGVAVGYYAGKDKPDGVSFFDVEQWDSKIIAYLTKGKQVAVTGQLRQERWEKDGKPQSKIKIFADRVMLLGSKSDAAPPAVDDGGVF